MPIVDVVSPLNSRTARKQYRLILAQSQYTLSAYFSSADAIRCYGYFQIVPWNERFVLGWSVFGQFKVKYI